MDLAALQPLVVPLGDGRTATITPAKHDFPERVEIHIAGPGAAFDDSKFLIESNHSRKTLAREAFISPQAVQTLYEAFRAWLRQAEEAEAAKATSGNTSDWPGLSLLLRRLHQTASDGVQYPPLYRVSDFAALLQTNRTVDPDSILVWPKDQIAFLCAIDLDFHDPTRQQPTERDWNVIERAFAPKPEFFWRTPRGARGLYVAGKGSTFTAEELAVGAAANLSITPAVVRCGGTIEIKTDTRHPASPRPNNPTFRSVVRRMCGDDRFEILARFGRAGLTESEIEAVLEAGDWEIGARLDHSCCPIDPGHDSAGQPVMVTEEGIFCFSCKGRGIRNGFMPWAHLASRYDVPVHTGEYGPLLQAVKHYSPFSHVAYLFKALAPEIMPQYLRVLYRALVKSQHKEKLEPMRLAAAMKPFHFVRGENEWLHADSLLAVGKNLAAADVNFLPTCCCEVATEEGASLEPVPCEVSIHINNGRIPGYPPLQPHLFEPIAFHHTKPENTDVVHVYPERKTTAERVSYLPPTKRMPLAQCEKVISDYFPGISMEYVEALIVAMGCAESGRGMIPMLWATGTSEAAKTTTIRVVLEMYGEEYVNLTKCPEDRMAQLFGEALAKTRAVVFDDFAKDTETYKAYHQFLIQLSRTGHTYHHLNIGMRTLPVNSCVVLTDWRLPEFFTHDTQFARRVHLIRLKSRVPQGWDKMSHFVEGWWRSDETLREAACSLHSWIVDEFFPEDDKESFDSKMERLGIHRMEKDFSDADGREAIRDLVLDLVAAVVNAPVAAENEKRLGRGYREIRWDTGDAKSLGKLATALVDSLGIEERPGRSPYGISNLKHVLDPFHNELHRYLALSEGVPAIEFETKRWGIKCFIRVVESGKPARDKTRKIGSELFIGGKPTRRET